MTIHILEEQLANKIAAGEVIERPASVVKELVENAIDAGASEVEVVIEEAGRKLIQVTDNGSGMTREDAVLCLQRHATSKISTTDDLFAIRTLGFRGEALPSIASVSHLRLVTRLHDAEIGTELLVRGGTITDLREVGCPPGTQIQVAQLFYNTPARLKFLKSDQTESAQMADLLNALSLCHHTVNMRLQQNGRQTLSRPSSARMVSHIAAWLGRQTAEAMVEVNLETPGIHVEGLVGKPETARGNRGAQLFFINGRRIVNRMLAHALEYAFEGLLAPKRYPVAVLCLTMDPAQVDVNVHPAKAEVRFNREGEVHAVVGRAVKLALQATQMVQELAVWQPGPQGVSRPTSRPVDFTTPMVLPHLTPATPGRATPMVTDMPPAVTAPSPQTGLRAIGQFHGTFLLAEGRDALLVINQHRAHERVIFERLWASFTRAEMQRLVLPATLHLGHREAGLLETHLETLAGFGFDIEPMSGQSYLVRGVPAALAGRNPESVLQEILTDLDAGIAIAQFECDDPAQRTLLEARRRLLASIACKAAVKAGKYLTPQEQVELLDRLQATEQPSLCPHGGPIIMTISQYELDRKFLR
ncbi:MAG TPA: DNA mismatch repair endonuclease MutL [Armatimonadota bacterium]|jgi:DNA mismatch repair protein MutL